MTFDNIRLDYKIIADIIEPGSKVLDLGCGDGNLLYYIAKEKDAKAQGIELDEKAIYKCVEKGLSVFHSDIDAGLGSYPDKCFDYIILNQSLQEIRRVEYIIEEALRVGKKVIVGVPNFAHFAARSMLFFRGKVPMTKTLPYKWYDTPNLRFLSISDFSDFCAEKKLKVVNTYYLGTKSTVKFFPNLFAHSAIFVITK